MLELFGVVVVTVFIIHAYGFWKAFRMNQIDSLTKRILGDKHPFYKNG